jgi:hypothetical protein
VLPIEALLSWACLNHAANVLSSFSSGKHFSYFCCFEEGSHWIYFLSISSWFFTTVFSMDAESLKHGATSSAHLPIFASACSKIFILSLTVIYFLFFFFIICSSSSCCEIHFNEQWNLVSVK